MSYDIFENLTLRDLCLYVGMIATYGENCSNTTLIFIGFTLLQLCSEE